MMHDMLLVPDIPEDDEIQEGVEGLAWEHATTFSNLTDVELGSDEFVELHKFLLAKYRETGDHLGFIQHSAMRVVQTLLATQKLALVVSKDDDTEDVSESLTYLAHIITSCLMWMHASYPSQWLTNKQWQHLDTEFRGVEFSVSIPSGGEKDDDDR